MAKKKSISDGLLAFGSNLATRVAGFDMSKASFKKPAHERPPLEEVQLDDIELIWDDEEERHYRDWLREQATERDLAPADWSEYGSEEAYRARLREEAQEDEDVPIEWEDLREREFRQRYIDMRKTQFIDANWEEYRAEEEYREKLRREQEAREKNPIVWDDAEEKKCQERYRNKKY